MGSKFMFTIICEDKTQSDRLMLMAENEAKRIENKISSWNPQSETSKINMLAGIEPVQVSSELFELINRCKNVSELSQGAFDITYGSFNNDLWKFNTNMKSLPDSALAEQAVEKINYRNVILNEEDSTVYLKDKETRIGFGAIGKGYAAEKIKQLLMSEGVKSGIVNAGGDLAVWGKQINGEEWTIAIANPDLKHSAYSFLKISNTSVVTSGNYEKYAIIDGVKYSHIINPKTGLPISGVKSVTVICNNTELADALATAVYVMGINPGIDLIEQLEGVECFIIDQKDKVHSTSNIKLQ
ncbi:MAG: FAD:protein FMN transferase [Bacteroidia bacterium]|nr:FAD:protein FMN transferase [Bacteroidia bacterium]